MKSEVCSRSTRNISVRRIDSCIKSVLRFGQTLEPAERGSSKARQVSGSGLRFIVAYSQGQGAPPCMESYLGQILRKVATEECEESARGVPVAKKKHGVP